MKVKPAVNMAGGGEGLRTTNERVCECTADRDRDGEKG